MNKTIKRNVVVSAILAITLCVSLIAGATFALFTSESKVNIAVSSGKVSVVANIDEDSVQTKQLYDTEYTQGSDNMYEGVATFGDDGLTLEKFVPGDGINFNIVVKNESNVTVQYRTIISCENDDGLFAGLKITVGDNENYSGVTLVSDWTELAVGSADEEVAVTIELPEDAGNEYQEKTCSISYKVEAVQGNAQVENPEDGTIYIYSANDLKALSNYKATTETKIELCADLDMTGKEMQAIQVGANSAITFNGNNHTISNIKIGAAYANGMTGAGNEVAGLFDVTENSGAKLTVNNLTIKDADVACAGYAAVVVGYANNDDDVITLNNIDIIGATIESDSVAAYVGYTTGSLTMTDCNVSELALTGEAGRPEKVGAFVGTANTASCVVTLTDCTNASELNIAGRVINGATMMVDGAYYVTTASALKSIMDGSEGEISIVLAAGTYNMPASAKGRTLTITGESKEGTIIGVVPSGQGEAGGQLDYSLDGSTVTFNNLTIKTNSQLYAGYARLSGTYNNCIIQNTYNCGVGDSAFYDCTFNITNEYLRVGGAYSAIFEGCTFNTDGRAILVFQDGTTNAQTVTVKDCTFNATASAQTWNGIHVSAVSIDGTNGTYVVNLEGNNVVDSDFNGLWQIKTGEANVTVNE